MSKDQVLQYLVQFTSDDKSLKQIQDKLNSLEANIKVKIDENSIAQLKDLNKQFSSQVQSLSKLQSSLDKYNKSLAEAKPAKADTGIKQAVEEQKQLELQFKQTSFSSDQLAQKYGAQADRLVELQSKINEYKASLRALKAASIEQGELTDAQRKEQEGIKTALKETERAYIQQRQSIVNATQAGQENVSQAQQGASTILSSYEQQVQSIAKYNQQIEATKSQMQALEDKKRASGELSQQEREQYAALGVQLQNLTATRNSEKNQIRKNEQAQRALANTSTQANDDIASSYQKSSQTLTPLLEQQRALKEEIRSLEAVQKSSGGATQEQNERLAALKLSLKDVNNEIAAQKRGAVATEQAQRTLGSSYNDTKKQMAALSVRIREIDDPLGKNKETVKILTERYDKLNNKLKTIDSSMGNHQRNVGNYTDSIRQAASAVAILQGPLGPLAGRLNSLATTLDKIRKSQIANTAATRTWGATIKTVLVSTGLGALLVVLGSVVQFLTKTERGQMMLRVSSAALSAVISTLTDVVIKFGEFAYNAFKNPQESIKQLWSGIQSFVQNIIKPTEVFEKVRDSISAVFTDPLGAIKGLWTAIKNNLVVRFESLIDTFGYVGKALQSAFKLDWEAFGENAKKAGLSAADAITGVEGTVDKVAKTTIALGSKIAEGLAPAIEFTKDLAKQATDNAKAQMAEERILNNLIIRQRELNVARAQQNADLQATRRFVRENRYELEKGVDMLNDVIAKERELSEEELNAAKQALDVQRARTKRFESDIQELDKLAQMEAEFIAMKEQSETRLMRLIRDRNTLETKIIDLNFKKEKDLMAFRLGNMEHENQVLLASKKGLLNELEVAEKAYSEVHGNELLQRAMQEQYYIEETARFMAAGFEEQIAMQMAKKNAALRIEREELDAFKHMQDLREKYQRKVFDTIQDAAFSGAEAIFGERKLISSAETIVDTYKGAQRALADNPPPSPIGIAAAAAVVAKGAIALRKINATKKGDKSIGGAGAGTANVPTQNFGLVEPSQIQLPSEIASQLTNLQPQFTPTIILQGDLDPEILSVKVQEGNNIRSGQSVGI